MADLGGVRSDPVVSARLVHGLPVVGEESMGVGCSHSAQGRSCQRSKCWLSRQSRRVPGAGIRPGSNSGFLTRVRVTAGSRAAAETRGPPAAATASRARPGRVRGWAEAAPGRPRAPGAKPRVRPPRAVRRSLGGLVAVGDPGDADHRARDQFAPADRAAVMNAAELAAVVDDPYRAEAQTLASGAEANLLLLGELRRSCTPK